MKKGNSSRNVCLSTMILPATDVGQSCFSLYILLVCFFKVVRGRLQGKKQRTTRQWTSSHNFWDLREGICFSSQPFFNSSCEPTIIFNRGLKTKFLQALRNASRKQKISWFRGDSRQCQNTLNAQKEKKEARQEQPWEDRRVQRRKAEIMQVAHLRYQPSTRVFVSGDLANWARGGLGC